MRSSEKIHPPGRSSKKERENFEGSSSAAKLAYYSILLSFSSIFLHKSSDKYFLAEPATRPKKI